MDESSEKPKYIEEVEEGIIIENIQLLAAKLIDGQRNRLDKSFQTHLYAIRRYETAFIDGEIVRPVAIYYETATGKIRFPTGNFGDYSALKTSAVSPQNQPEQIQILLYRQGGTPSTDQYSAALMGEEIEIPPDRRIMPERIDPAQIDLVGVVDKWGKDAEYVENAAGDVIILKTIRNFNSRYGPPR